MGFEPLVNQRLLPPTFPRYTRLRTRREALHYLDELVTRIRQCGKVTHTHTFHQAMVSATIKSDKIEALLQLLPPLWLIDLLPVFIYTLPLIIGAYH